MEGKWNMLSYIFGFSLSYFTSSWKYQAAETWTSQKFQKLSDPLKWAKLYQSFPAPITSAVLCKAADFIQMNSRLKHIHANKYLCKTLQYPAYL